MNIKRSFALLLPLFVVVLSAWAFITRPTYREGQKTYRFLIHAPMATPYSGRNLIGWLTQNNFDVAGFNWQQGTIEVITDDNGIQTLKAHGLDGVIRQQAIGGHTPGVGGTGNGGIDLRYLTPQKTEEMLKAINARFPQLTRLEQIGKSNEGRPIWALLISTTPDLKNPKYFDKATMIFDGMHHAREIMTSEIVMDVAPALLSAMVAHQQPASGILDRWNIWIVPMLNVDGNNMVWTSDAWWRKNARADRTEVFGVDLNRNYPFKWNACNGSSGSQNSETYRGAGPASEPETQALMRLGQMTQPSASLSYHSYSELILYPYGCNGVLSGENALLESLGKELSAILPVDSGRGNYTPGTPWQILYSVDGDSMGYLHAEYGATAITFEVNQEFQPPYSLREPTLIKHRKAWQYFLSRVDSSLLSMKVIDGRTGQPTLARIDISTIPHKYGEKPFHTNPNGNFFKVLNPGSYAVKATLADGRTSETSIQMQSRAQGQAVQVTVP